MMTSLSGGPASMGAAAPYAIAAKFPRPDRPAIGLVGEGAIQISSAPTGLVAHALLSFRPYATSMVIVGVSDGFR